MPDDLVAPDPAATNAADTGLVAAAVAELYAGSPEAFTARRAELVAAARVAGDRAAARTIGALRKPTRAAWVVNRLARTDPGATRRLARLGAGLLAAQRAGDGARLRELSAERGPLLDGLTSAALTAAGLTDPPPGLRAEVTATLAAALADPSVAAGLAAGTLTQRAEWAGFGVLPSDGGGADSGQPETPAAVADSRRGGPAAAPRSPAVRDRPANRPRPAAVRMAGAPSCAADDVAAEAAATARERGVEAEAKRLAAQAAERAARQRLAFEESERTVAAVSAAAADATTAEERLEEAVRDLEERLTKTRADLAAARLRARRAEAAERRARLAHERLARRNPQRH